MDECIVIILKDIVFVGKKNMIKFVFIVIFCLRVFLE